MVVRMNIPRLEYDPDKRGAFAPPPSYVEPSRGMRWEKDWEMSDEFDKVRGAWGRRSRWHRYHPNWAGRGLGWFSHRNVYIERGSLFLVSREEQPTDEVLRVMNRDRRLLGYRRYSTAFVRTRAKRRYGYFEIYCKMMDSAISSAFWFGRRRDYEIDVFEYSTSEKPPTSGREFKNLFMMNTHVFTGPNPEDDIASPLEVDVGRDLSKEDVKVGLLWTKERIVWYLNDVKVREKPNTDWHKKLHLQMDSEVFADWFGLPGEYGKNNLPTKQQSTRFEIKYVRSFRMVRD
eukprot:TRINITY_DN412_c0_g2_i1.p1 TRINITY_DN412_c0_g2~~TRINITY_DN412_c0_g2_i1.p1  ORF type:complete len:289 (-),score=38.67 TRINITY_DN412_c0_g2_i1:836-1702(-)